MVLFYLRFVLVGTATCLGGIVVESEDVTKTHLPWLFICVSIGDCKVFIFCFLIN